MYNAANENKVTDDEFKSLSKLFKKGTSTQLEGARKQHESSAGSTQIQMIMAGALKDATPEEYNKAPFYINLEKYIEDDNIDVKPNDNIIGLELKDYMRLLPQDFQETDKEKILDYLLYDGLYNDRNDAEIAFNNFRNNQDQQDPKKQKIEQSAKTNSSKTIEKFKYFKKFYSWFSGVKIHRTKINTSKGESTSMSDENEDEHVVPFGFMLLFGGGLARIINKDNYNEEIKVKRSYRDWNENSTEFIEWLVGYDDITDSSQFDNAVRKFNMFNIQNEKKIPEDQISDRVKEIERYGMDLGEIIWLYNDTDARLILNCLGYDTEHKIAEFCRNMFKINYYGYYLSEGKANSVKSDHLFVKLEKNNDTIKFSPSITRIRQFNEELFAWANCFNQKKIEKLDSIIEKRPQKGSENQDNIIYKDPGLSSKWLPKGARNISGYCDDINALIGEKNMVYILNILCHYLNKDILNRIIFNILMTRIYRYKKSKAMPLGQYTGPQPEETKTKQKLIEAYVEWLTNFKESLETTSDNTQLVTLKNSVEEQINFLNSEQVLSMQASQINRQMNSFHENLKQNYSNIPEFNFSVTSTGTTAESLGHATTKAAVVGTPIKDIQRPVNKLTERPDIAQKNLVQVGKKENEDKFELNFFRAYLEDRQNIRVNFENLQRDPKTAGTLVYQAIDNLDSSFYKNIKVAQIARRQRNIQPQKLKMSLELESQPDEESPAESLVGSPPESPDSQASIGGRKKTRKRNKKHLLRMRRKL
tara:strand:- start:6489 stop:8765 length:2277 start_codon:yes stop_codon:yes gene_type:complete